MSRSRIQSLIPNIDHMTCSLSSKNLPRNTVDFEAACSVYIRFRGVNGYMKTTSSLRSWRSCGAWGQTVRGLGSGGLVRGLGGAWAGSLQGLLPGAPTDPGVHVKCTRFVTLWNRCPP